MDVQMVRRSWHILMSHKTKSLCHSTAMEFYGIKLVVKRNKKEICAPFLASAVIAYKTWDS